VEGQAAPGPLKHVTRAEMMEIDRRSIAEFGIPESALMERAGAAVAREIARRWPGRPVDVLAGPGRNGGDGLVVARLAGGRVVRVGEKWAPAPRAVIVDALFGTGLTRDVAGPARTMVEAINALDRSEHPVISIDLPSGLDADTGEARGAAVRASVTVTMGLPKRGFQAPGAAACLGELVVADIGHPRELLG
jgi:NAD(P)H-hydrate epimerase